MYLLMEEKSITHDVLLSSQPKINLVKTPDSTMNLQKIQARKTWLSDTIRKQNPDYAPTYP